MAKLFQKKCENSANLQWLIVWSGPARKITFFSVMRNRTLSRYECTSTIGLLVDAVDKSLVNEVSDSAVTNSFGFPVIKAIIFFYVYIYYFSCVYLFFLFSYGS